MSFSDKEKARVKHFLAYPDWVALAGSIQLGYPSASQPAFLVDDAFARLTSGGEESVRKDLCACEKIEAQLLAATDRFKAKELGTLKINENETEQLRKELNFWTARLASDLGVVSNPYSQFQHTGAGGGGRNATVEG